MSLKKTKYTNLCIYIYTWSDVNQKKHKRNSKIIPKKTGQKKNIAFNRSKMVTATYLAIPLGRSRYFIKVQHQLQEKLFGNFTA